MSFTASKDPLVKLQASKEVERMACWPRVKTDPWSSISITHLVLYRLVCQMVPERSRSSPGLDLNASRKARASRVCKNVIQKTEVCRVWKDIFTDTQ